MAIQFTPCPACGAVGEVGSNCQFCGTTIILKEGATSSTERVPHVRTVTPQQYAEKISIYQNVEGSKNSSNLMYVSIGDEEGLINLNGDLIYPLQHKYCIYIISDTAIFLSMRNESHFKYHDYDNHITANTLNKFYTELLNKQVFFGTPKELYEDVQKGRYPYWGKEHGMLLNLKTNEKFNNVKHSAISGGNCKFYIEDGEMDGVIDPVNWKIEYSKIKCIKDICKKISIDKNLLTQIQNYIREVETNPNYEKTAIIEIPDIDSDMAIGFERLDSEMGIRIEVCLGVMMDEEICRFEDCDLYDFFGNDNKGFEYVELHLPYNAEAICLVIQYLSKVIYNKSNGINLSVLSLSSINSSASDNVERNMSIIGSIICFAASIFLFIVFFSFGDVEFIIGAIVALVCGIRVVKKSRNPKN